MGGLPKIGRALGRCDGGNVAVEFALLLAPLLMIVFGFFEFGRYFFINDSLANAAREGARMAIVRGAASGEREVGAAEIESFVRRQAPALADPDLLRVTASFSPNNSPGSKVLIEIEYPYEFLLPGVSALGTLTITKTASMTISR